MPATLDDVLAVLMEIRDLLAANDGAKPRRRGAPRLITQLDMQRAEQVALRLGLGGSTHGKAAARNGKR